MRYWLILIFVLGPPANAQLQWLQFKTLVEPLPGENLAGACVFELSIPKPNKPVRAVWITYNRGYDISRFYSDPDVLAFAKGHALALMLAHQCPAKSPPTLEHGEMDMDPSHGIGRSLFVALDDFAKQSGHVELSSTKLILLGFSGTSALFANFIGYVPDRILASILTNPGQSDPYGMDHVNLPPQAIGVPEFIIVGGSDDVAGTQRPYDYFHQYRYRGAPWIFLVQNGVPHCCVINTKALILEWLDEMMKLRKPAPSRPLRKVDVDSGWVGFIRPCESSKRDHWGGHLWNVCSATIQPISHATPANQLAAAWFPTHRLALRWLTFIQQQQHPADSFPNGPR